MMKRKSRMHAPLVRRVLPSFLALVLGVGCSEPRAFAAVPAAAPPAPFATPPVLAGTPDVATLVARVTPAVVNITTIHEVRADDSPFGFGFDPFGLGSDGRRGRGDQVYRQKALGSGFLVDAGGHVVTNAHVVEGADSVKVRLADDREFEAKVRGRDTTLDIAVLELVGARDLPQVSLGSSEQLRVGEYVVAIGNPFGLGNTVTMGIVSAKSRAIGARPVRRFHPDRRVDQSRQQRWPALQFARTGGGDQYGDQPQRQRDRLCHPGRLAQGCAHAARRGRQSGPGSYGRRDSSRRSSARQSRGARPPQGCAHRRGRAGRAGRQSRFASGRCDLARRRRRGRSRRRAPSSGGASRTRFESARRIFARTGGAQIGGFPRAARATLKRRARPVRLAGEGRPERVPASALGLGLVDVPGQGVAVQQVAPGGRADGQLERGDFLLEINHTPIGQAADVARIVSSAPAGQALLFKVRRGNRVRFVAIEAH